MEREQEVKLLIGICKRLQFNPKTFPHAELTDCNLQRIRDFLTGKERLR